MTNSADTVGPSAMACAASESASQSGTSSCEASDSSPTDFRKDIGDLQEEALSSEFMNWTYKNVGLLGERNREMAEQAVELRSVGSFKDERLTEDD